MTAPLWVVVPAGIDDPATPSGGNRYDRRVIDELREVRLVHEIVLDGPWPRPGDPALAERLAELPDGAEVLLDGLVACGVPELIEPSADRLRMLVLVHLSLGDETGLSEDQIKTLSAYERRTVHAAASVVTTSEGAAKRLIDRHGLAPEKVHVAAPGVDPAPLARGSRLPEKTPAAGTKPANGANPPDKTDPTGTANPADKTSPAGRTGSADRTGPTDGSGPDTTGAVSGAGGTTGGRRLGCVAAVIPRKGQDVLVEALTRLDDLDWDCVCVGALDRAPEFVRNIRTNERVRFVGTATGAALELAYESLDLLILPSRAETYGMVVTEALARGIPVLASDVDGVPEALGRASDGSRPGLLVPADDPGALAEALRQWLTDADLRAAWRVSAADRRKHLRSWQDTAREITAAFG